MSDLKPALYQCVMEDGKIEHFAGCFGKVLESNGIRVLEHTPLYGEDVVHALQAALEKAAELAQEKSEELVNRWASDLGATVETQAAGAAAHIVSGLAGDILGLLAKAERSALQQKERER